MFTELSISFRIRLRALYFVLPPRLEGCKFVKPIPLMFSFYGIIKIFFKQKLLNLCQRKHKRHWYVESAKIYVERNTQIKTGIKFLMNIYCKIMFTI